MSDRGALAAQRRHVQLSLCIWGTAYVWEWGARVVSIIISKPNRVKKAVISRVTLGGYHPMFSKSRTHKLTLNADFFSLRPNWSSILGIIAINVEHLSSIDFFSHNDMDMMEIGNGNLTIEEERTHFAAWAFLKSPILLGTNVSGIRIRLSNFIYLFGF